MISQQVKFESSPANSISHSFPSTPGNDQVWDSPLLPTNDSFTPGSFDDEYDEESLNGTPAPELESEKKPAVKKRKSWGQQLPEPKTNLPPRKRAKTEDEKEQRRVERVLRNRRAAQTSRERKRLEVEGLEKAKQDVEQRNRHLERRLQELEARNQQLEQLVASGGGDLSVYRQPANTNNFNSVPLRCSTPITLTPELFPARDSQRHNSPCSTLYSVHSSPQQRVDTVNPASLSPEMRPVDESMNSFSDMTQHPAVSVGNPLMDLFGQQIFGSDSVPSNDNFTLTRHDMGLHNALGASQPYPEDWLDNHAGLFTFEHDPMPSCFDEYIDLSYEENSSRVPDSWPSDTYAEEPFGLQPSVGASFIGCDAGSNAVSV